MIRNYLITAYRNILRQKGYSLIIVIGLTIGIAIFGLILLYVNNEFRVDRFNKNFNRIYRMETENWAILGTAYGPEIASNFPEVTTFSRVSCWEGSSVTVKRADKMTKLEDMLYADSSVFKIFSFHMIEGDPDKALSAPFSVILTQSEARKLFGKEDPMGQILKVNNKHDYTVTGIIKDVPRFHLNVNAIAAFHTLKYTSSDSLFMEHHDQWNYYTFFLLKDKTDPKLLEKKINDFYAGKEFWYGQKPNFTLRPLKDIYFTQVKNDFPNPKSNKGMMILLMSIGIFILVIGCVNFINLTTARSSKRSQEIGVRKVMGASQRSLVLQFLGEAVMITLVSTELALVLIELLKPGFCNLIGKELSVETDTKIWYLVLAIPFPVIIGVLSGFYPAMYLNKFKPVSALRKEKTKGRGALFFKRALIVLQFTISIFLIIATLTVYKQLNYVRNKELGFNKENIITLTLNNELVANLETLKDRLLSNPVITNVSFSTQSFGDIGWQESLIIKGEGKQYTYLAADPEFLPTMELRIKEGRNFERSNPTDMGKVLLNEEAVRHFQLTSPVGAMIGEGPQKLEVLGVLKDFHFNSLHSPIAPLVIRWYHNYMENANIRINGSPRVAIEHIQKIWSGMSPNFIFEYRFMDESFDKLYKSEMKLGKIFMFMALLAILIASIGLLGLSSYLAEQRTKEIGVRKVMGASENSIIWDLTSEFTMWVLVSGFIAIPAAYIVMNNWLNQFAYHTAIDTSILIISWLVGILIAALTVSWQAYKAANKNPVEALRYE
ncbi:MAG TPA: FtsX-like permease family protein [Bacteroidales bacterium]